MFFSEAGIKKTKRRYELKEKLGEGGMGAVWRAFDTVLETDVAMKLLLDVHDPNALRLFYQECEKQAALTHPNIVEIRDKGTIEDGTVRTPYIVMPLLRGKTLATLIRSTLQPLPTERCLDILTQASRGLQAAHDAGLLHRDIKPSNLFVLDDDSVKLLDFGIAHRLDVSMTTGRKGTLLYMSPEQLAMKALTRSSDVFSLGVVCYEMLTRQQPFLKSSEDGIAEAIRGHHPSPVSTLNREVSEGVSQVVCKAMAKNPSHRFASMRELSDALRRAHYDSRFTVFEPSQFQPRLAKARAEFLAGHLQYAQELTEELLSEGYLVEGVLALNTQVSDAVKQQTVEHLMESARARKQDGEYRLALQRVTEVLELESHHNEALILRHEIETSRTEADIMEWIKLGRQHLEKLSFFHARQAAQRVLEAQPEEERARELISKIERREQEVQRMHEQKQAAYAAAMEAEAHNEITAALSNMRVVLELEKHAPDSSKPAQLAIYQSFYNKLHAEHEAVAGSYAEAKQALERGDYAVANQLCDDFLTRMPRHTLFKALKFDIEQRWRRTVSLRLLETEEAVEHEPDLGKRVGMLEEAVRINPGVAEFARLLESNRQKLNLVQGIVSRARELEARQLYSEALAQWETLETIHPHLPRLQFEIQNLRLRRQLSERMEQKSRWLAEINGAAERGELEESIGALEEALDHIPDDCELLELRRYLRQQSQLATRAEQMLAEGHAAMASGSIDLGLGRLREAYDLGSKIKRARTELVEGLLTAARASQERPRQARAYLEEILTLEPGNHAAVGFFRFLEEHTAHAETDEALAQARHLRNGNDLGGAMDVLKRALTRYPQSTRIKEFLRELDESHTERRGRDLDVLRRKRLEANSIVNKEQLFAAAATAEQIADRYQEDEEFQTESRMLKARLQTVMDACPGSSSVQAVPLPSLSAPALPAKSAAGKRPSIPVPKGRLIPGAGIASTLLLAALGVWATHHSHKSTSQSIIAVPKVVASPKMASVSIIVDPSGAIIRENGNLLGVANPTLTLSLPAGEPQLVAEFPGYASQEQQVKLAAGSAAQLQFKLLPAAEVLQVTGRGRIQVDEEKAVKVRDKPGAIGLSSGEHTLTWQDEDGNSVRLHAQVDPSAAAALRGLENDEHGLAVSTLDGKAQVYSAKGSVVMLDGKYAGTISSDFLSLDLPYGEHSLSVGPRKQELVARINSEPGRQLLVAFGGSGTHATLTTLAGVDGVSVRLMRGTKTLQQGIIAGGHLEMTNIPAGSYIVVATLAGTMTPFTQSVEIRPQEQMKITLPFQAASGVIRAHAPAGTSITLDGLAAGQTGQDGILIIDKVNQGLHVVEARFRGASLRRNVVMDDKGPSTAQDISFEPSVPANGILTLLLHPQDAQAAVFGSNNQRLSGVANRFELPAGKYRIEVSASGYASQSLMTEVAATQTLPLNITLYPLRASTSDPAVSGWDAAQWTLNAKAHTLSHKTQGVGLYAAKPEFGTYVFSGIFGRALLPGWQKAQWVVGYRDPQNYLLFSLSHDTLSFTSVVSGKKSPTEQFTVHDKSTYQVMLRVGADGVTVSMRDGDHWTLVHAWSVSSQNLSIGGFGFKDVVTLTDFSYTR